MLLNHCQLFPRAHLEVLLSLSKIQKYIFSESQSSKFYQHLLIMNLTFRE